MRKKFVWKKWRDPLLSDLKDNEWPGFDLDEDGEHAPYHGIDKRPVMHTPLGMLSVVGNTFASSEFDFWTLQTNFDITDKLVEVIEDVPGIETFERYTRYRARVGFPRSGLFQPGVVMHDVETNVKAYDFQNQNRMLVGLEMEAAQKAIETREKMSDKYDHWAIWIVPNGNLEVLGTDSVDSEYMSRLSLLKEAQQVVGGRLLTSSESE